jgi:hypothetical protein
VVETNFANTAARTPLDVDHKVLRDFEPADGPAEGISEQAGKGYYADHNGFVIIHLDARNPPGAVSRPKLDRVKSDKEAVETSSRT